MAVKVVMLALLLIAFIYIVYRAADWYFTKRERQDRIEALKQVRQMARDEAIWADDDPETFDREQFESELTEMGVEPDLVSELADRMERGDDLNIDLEVES